MTRFCGISKTQKIKVGDKVRYIAEDSKEDKESGFYPPRGQSERFFGFVAMLISFISDGRKEQQKEVAVGTLKKKASNWFKT